MEWGRIVFILQDMVGYYYKSSKIETACRSLATHLPGLDGRFHLDIRVHGQLLLAD